jgi:hypothetical protein
MKNQSLQPHLNLTKDQLKTIIDQHILEHGVNHVFEIVLNNLMYSERAACLTDNFTPGNKANGYRSLIKPGIGQGLKLAVPRDRLGIFKPLILSTCLFINPLSLFLLKQLYISVFLILQPTHAVNLNLPAFALHILIYIQKGYRY